ncbi:MULTISPECIES: imidazole glycerol phosphate synthase subunit HisH [Cysteiniphilum]|uniref:Imidazole glycerol phosphate synthase subunit HisH n=1 Tax=Cysteiniphilum litorale TaxID=2056700 RepID=A0A8J2Z3I9_9GAMM|nr:MULTISPECIES: imidazole glycerol phosphate synthase subunit HisH [Cysteiniphilum]GGF94541.1 imidazole glycerol phosphate synthase subunit HisH 2 [Cysteiniphilum litorale]
MIGVVDYGVGNVKAFVNIYKRLNIKCQIVNCEKELHSVEKLILPGVGSFDYAMSKLNSSGLKESIIELVMNDKVPILGVCVGMQMLLNSSEEGELEGLGWISGVVKKFIVNDLHKLPLPHMGWNVVSKMSNHQILSNLETQARFYFLHSYYADCDDQQNVLAMANYQDDYACIVNKENIYGMQCHPEKSHHNGVQFLKNFGEL